MKIYYYVFPPEEELEAPHETERRKNELLDIYSLYLDTGIPSIKEELIHKAFQIHLKDAKFSFII